MIQYATKVTNQSFFGTFLEHLAIFVLFCTQVLLTPSQTFLSTKEGAMQLNVPKMFHL
jgi:hypothetical protein